MSDPHHRPMFGNHFVSYGKLKQLSVAAFRDWPLEEARTYRQ
jgi:hypothetical protein